MLTSANATASEHRWIQTWVVIPWLQLQQFTMKRMRKKKRVISQFWRWNTHFKFNLKINTEKGLNHTQFALFLASDINKQCKLPHLTWLSVQVHKQCTTVIQTWDVRKILPFAIIFLILCHQTAILQKAMCRRSYSWWPLLPSLLLPWALGSNQPDYFAGTGS